MTTIGKALVVLHLALSIVFMAFAGAVYTAQTNWKKAEKDAQSKREEAERQTKVKQAAYEQLLTERDQARAESENTILKLKGDIKRLDDEVKTLTADNKQLRKDVDQQRDQSALTTAEMIERKKEADLQREKNGELFITRETLEKDLTEKNDTVYSMERELKLINEKYNLLLTENRVMKGFLLSKDLTTDPKQMAALTAPPPPLTGRVLEVSRPNRNSKQEFVEISIGRDSGLEKGHKLTAKRGSKFIGEMTLLRVEADKSVGTVRLRAPNAEFQVGDEVTTLF